MDGDLSNFDAIDRNDSPPAIPREISSRSADDNRSEHHSPQESDVSNLLKPTGFGLLMETD